VKIGVSPPVFLVFLCPKAEGEPEKSIRKARINVRGNA